MIFSSPDNEVEKLGKNYITVAMVQQVNSDLTQTQFKTILREPVKGGADAGCEERVLYKGSWILPNDPIARRYIDLQKR